MKTHSLNEKTANKIKKILKKEKFNSAQIKEILSSYTTFDGKEDLDKCFDVTFTLSLACLDRNDYKSLTDKHNREYLQLKGYLKNESLSIKQALSVFRYTLFPNNMLNLKRLDPRKQLENLKNSTLQDIAFIESELKTSFRGGDVLGLMRFVEESWIKNQCKNSNCENYDVWENDVKNYCINNGLEALTDTFINNFMPEYNEYSFAKVNLEELENAMKSQLSYNMILYRGERCTPIERQILFNNMKRNMLFGETLKSNKPIKTENGYTSTSLSYETSFAKYPEYILAYRLIVPKGTQGLSVNRISSFPKEYEVLLNSNDMFLVDCDPNFVDQFGCKKFFLTVLVLSKDRSCYKDLGAKKENNKEIQADLEEDIFKKVK